MFDRQRTLLIIHLCVQHDAHEAAHRAGPCATSDTCLSSTERMIHSTADTVRKKEKKVCDTK